MREEKSTKHYSALAHSRHHWCTRQHLTPDWVLVICAMCEKESVAIPKPLKLNNKRWDYSWNIKKGFQNSKWWITNLFLDDAREERTNTAICRKGLSKPTLKRDKSLRMMSESQVRQTHNQKNQNVAEKKISMATVIQIIIVISRKIQF